MHTHVSLIFFLLFLLSFTASAFSIDKNDEIALLKIKKQLGNPDTLRSWVKGSNFCSGGFGNPSDDLVIVACNSFTGRVTSLSMQNLHVVAPFPEAICDLTELYFFGFFQSPGIYGPIPSCITKLSNLEFFGAENTSISGPMPDFHNNTKIRTIWMPNNHLSGKIPPILSALPQLQTLDLSFNHLTGTVPSGIIHVPYSTLRLSHNNLTGELPKCYGWVDFDTFDVGNNRLSGDASFIFRQNDILNTVILANNSFTFDLSYINFSLNNLYWLDLSHNNIYGKVPDSLTHAHLLGFLNLSFNKLCGELPQGGNMWQFKAEDFANNECLCGSPLPQCFNATVTPAQAPIYTPPF